MHFAFQWPRSILSLIKIAAAQRFADTAARSECNQEVSAPVAVCRHPTFQDSEFSSMEPLEHSIPVKGIIPLELLFEDEGEESAVLCDMAEEAQSYLESFPWCVSIEEGYFGDGVPDAVAVFLFRIEPTRPEIDRWFWVIVGDLPPAYLLTHTSKSPTQALEGYIEEMSKWVALAKEGKFSEKVIPVDAPSTPENAEDLEERLTLLARNVVPAFRKAELEREQA